jgi:hypothetical protein
MSLGRAEIPPGAASGGGCRVGVHRFAAAKVEQVCPQGRPGRLVGESGTTSSARLSSV